MTPEDFDRFAADLAAIPVEDTPIVHSKWGAFTFEGTAPRLKCACPLTHIALLHGMSHDDLYYPDGGEEGGWFDNVKVVTRVQQLHPQVHPMWVWRAFDLSDYGEAPEDTPLDERLFFVLMTLAAHIHFPT